MTPQAFPDFLLQCSESNEKKVTKDQANTSAACIILYAAMLKERDTPFPLYVGLKLHANNRQKGIISTFHALCCQCLMTMS